MASRRKKKRTPYRWRAFTHWLNLTFLAAGGVAAMVIDPSVLLALGPIEVGLMWLIPDLPRFRESVDKQVDAEELVNERAYYIEQLWGVAPQAPRSLGERIAGLFTESKSVDVDERILDRSSKTYREYREMRMIIAKLRELEMVRGVSITGRDINRFEQVINGYLRLVIAARTLAKAISGINANELRREVAEVEAQLEGAAPSLKAVLLERKRLKETRLERLPKLQATLELFRTRADALVYQMHNIHGQVLSDPGLDVNAFLEDLVERQEIMVDPLGALEADQVLSEILHPSPQVSAGKRAAAAGAKAGKRA